MTYDELMTTLKHGDIKNVYMLCGEETYYTDCVSDYFETQLLDETARQFDQLVFYGRDLPGLDIAPAISAARGYSMMGGKKVIIVKEAQTVKKWDSLGMYLDNPQPNSVLVICYKYGNPDKRLSAFKNFEKKGGVWLQSDKMKDYQVETWIRNYIAEKNKELQAHGDSITIDARITKILADSIGNDLKQIQSALQKLIDGRPEGVKVIDAALVERNIGISKDYNVFELQSALIAGDVVKANRIAHYFATSKDHPMVREMSLLYEFFAKLLIYHYIPDKNERVVASALGINPYFVRDYVTAAKRYPVGKTFRIIGYFCETDARLKGINNPGATEDDLWKELIYKIMH